MWHVLRIPKFGVYVGLDNEKNPLWSKKAKNSTHAITFTDSASIRRLLDCYSQFMEYTIGSDYSCVPVEPDRPDGNISKEACQKLGIW